MLHSEVVDDPALQGSRLSGDGSVDVVAVHHDSRAVEPRSLFCCVRGEHVDGHDFAPAAVARGAVALLCERKVEVDVPALRVASTRRAMGPVAAAVYGRPSSRLAVVGVTGTNGKTTVVHFLRSILDTAGRPTEAIGTLTGVRTTPEAPDLQRTFVACLAEGRQAVAMEVSSHALALHRVDGTHFAVAVFTNLSQDHLDFHGDMASYFAAKARLFEPGRSARGVVNRDDPYGRQLADDARIPIVGYSLRDVADVDLGTRGSSFSWHGERCVVPIPGLFNISNALAAATAALELGVDPSTVARGLEAAGPVPGRFEVIDEGQRFLVVVDYAHTPDGLRSLLAAVRPLAQQGRVIVVFGAGGDRDATKRPEMGRVAAEGADQIVLTSDNPRSEDPDAVIAAVREGITTDSDLVVDPDRGAAIQRAIVDAEPGDVVVIAGKGHETTQTIGERVLPFDDRAVARLALATRTSGAGQ